MNANILELYFKLNLLMGAAFLWWVLTRQLAKVFRFETSHARQLKVARIIILSVLLSVPLVVFLNGFLPGWVKGVEKVVSRPGLIQEFTFTAGMGDLLKNKFRIGMITLAPEFVLFSLLLAGLLLQIGRMTIQVGRLRKIICGATEWKSINGIHLLISDSITSPFSTRALGSRQIVMPAQLLESPGNLRLAIKHELQHVRNGDLEWVILLEAIKVLCFWNPFAWLWHNEFDCLQEFACDEVLVNERKVNSQAYGICLLDVASNVSGRALLASSNMVPKFSLWQNHKTQLKRRILMLMKVSNKNNVMLKTICYSLLLGFGLSDTAVMVLAADSGGSAVPVKPVALKDAVPPKPVKPADKDVLPVLRVNPTYPAEALEHGTEGSVVVDFTIDENGKVQDAIAVKNCIETKGSDLKRVCKNEERGP